MISFTTKILRFAAQKEKTGWSYIEISKRRAAQLNPGCRKSFRVKGRLDNLTIEKKALLPMGDGKFILPFNATMRKVTGKSAGDTLRVEFERDESNFVLSTDLAQCLKDDPRAHEFFKTLPKGHQRYFSNWIESAKTADTKSKRITMALIALASRQGFGEMMRANKNT